MKKLMKRILSILTAMLLLAVPAFAEEAAEAARVGVELSYERITNFCAYVKELATGDYLSIKQATQAQQDIAAGWAAGMSGQPRMVVKLNVQDTSYIQEIRLTYMHEEEVIGMEAESGGVIEIWWTLCSLAGSEASVNEPDYSGIMELNGLLNASVIYAEEASEDYAVYIVLYDDASPLLLLVNAENGAVSIQGMFLPSKSLAKCTNYGQVALWLMFQGLPITCEEITP